MLERENMKCVQVSPNTGTLWSPPSPAWTLGRRARWRWCGRSGGASVHHRRPGKRTVSLLASPERLPLCWRRAGWLQRSPCLGARSCSQCCCSSVPRKSRFCPTSCRDPLPSWSSFCRRLLWKLSHSILSPSSSARSAPPCTTPVSRNQTSLGGQGTAARSNVSPSCFPRTEKGLCVLCLDPGWVFWRLMKQIESVSQYLTHCCLVKTKKTKVTGYSHFIGPGWILDSPHSSTLQQHRRPQFVSLEVQYVRIGNPLSLYSKQ